MNDWQSKMMDQISDLQSEMMSYIVDITKAEIDVGGFCSSLTLFVSGVEFDDVVLIAARRREDDVEVPSRECVVLIEFGSVVVVVAAVCASGSMTVGSGAIG